MALKTKSPDEAEALKEQRLPRHCDGTESRPYPVDRTRLRWSHTWLRCSLSGCHARALAYPYSRDLGRRGWPQWPRCGARLLADHASSAQPSGYQCAPGLIDPATVAAAQKEWIWVGDIL